MTHEEIRESLSVYFDGQLWPEKTVEISAHVAACPERRAALDEFREHGLSGNYPSFPTHRRPKDRNRLGNMTHDKKPRTRYNVLRGFLSVIRLNTGRKR